MIKHSPYFSRMSLLLDLLPITNENPDLVLKGGTAINLFFRDLPRLSVDIDLMVLPALDRLASLDFIDQSTHKFQNRIKQVMPQLETIISRRTDGKATTLTCIKQHDLVKIEINPVIRQGLGTPSFLTLQPNAQLEFERNMTIKVAAFEDVYGSKLCAALDRQHPRDWFDLMLLLENEGITDSIRKAFIVYLLSHNRPIAELLNPHLLDVSKQFDTEFAQMTRIPFTYKALEEIRLQVINHIQHSFTQNERQFLLTFKNGAPQWELSGIKELSSFPAVQWKLMNIQKMSTAKRKASLERLKSVLLL